MTQVTHSLNDLFKQHRLIFWYDPQLEMTEEFEAFQSAGVEKVRVENDEFALKHRIVRQQPDTHFLIYLPYARPAHRDNWLLDLELAGRVYHADGISLILQQLGLQEEQRGFIETHREFFNSKDRIARFKDKLHPDDEERDWKLKMLAVICREDHVLESCLFALFLELSERDSKKWQELGKYQLEGFFWERIAHQYGYQSAAPSLLDFIIECFVTVAPLNREPKLGEDGRILMTKWQDSSRYQPSFKHFSKQLEEDLNIRSALENTEGYEPLLNIDLYEAVERKIIVELRDAMVSQRLQEAKLQEAINRRKSSYWYAAYTDLYSALLSAQQLQSRLRSIDFSFDSCQQAVEQYTTTFWKVDQFYRKFHFHCRQSGQTTLLDPIRDKVEKLYANEFLLKLGDRFQNQLDAVGSWPLANLPSQTEFFKKHVKPVLDKGNKLFVIISDALRYEIGQELHQAILREDRFRSNIDYQLSTLPSYTQLGMASLLPHQRLEIQPNDGNVLADGMRTAGTDARSKVLANSGYKATAIKAQEFLNMNAKEEGRALSRDHDLVYIYQNEIDHVGDKRETEGNLTEAAEKEIHTLIAILKKVAAVNGNNAIITADHGFLFTQDAPDESDFTTSPEGKEVGMINRRFAFAKQFDQAPNHLILDASKAGLDGEYQIALPKSINRYRRQGSGARYVHGGASLQEIVVPILHVNKGRAKDTSKIEVDIIQTGSKLITGNQFPVTFYQDSAAKEKQLGRHLQVGFYAKDGTLLSDTKELIFDSHDEDPRRRESKETFVFSKLSDLPQHRNSEIFLRLEERIAGSNHLSLYKEVIYRLKKTFETDFEF